MDWIKLLALSKNITYITLFFKEKANIFYLFVISKKYYSELRIMNLTKEILLIIFL